MEDQLISFETALLAKEKGFQLGSRKSYTHYHKSFTYDGDPNHPESHIKNDVRTDYDFYTVNNAGTPLDISNKHYTIYEAPTQSLLQKWLRKIHNIDVQPICNYHYKSGRQYHLGIIFINKDNKVDTIIIKEPNKSLDRIYRYYSSYEEALEEGLFQALNLIESK